MRVVEVTDFSAPPHLAERPDAVAGENEVLVRVQAVGLHRVVRGRAAGKHYSSGTLPFVPGIDGVGVTDSGQPVWFMTFDAGASGSLADLVAVPTNRIVPLPVGADPVEIAASVNSMMAAWMSLFPRGALQPGQHLLIHGATGAAGRATAQLARGIAGRVTALGRNRQALDALVTDGLATDIVQLGDDPADLLAPLTSVASSLDLCVDFLWGPVAEQLWAALGRSQRRPGHTVRHVEVGTMAGLDAELPGSLLRSTGIQILGSAPGAYSIDQLITEIPALLQRMVDDHLGVDHRDFPLDQFDAAWQNDSSARSVVLFS